MNVKLGKRPPVHDDRKLMMAKYAAALAPAPTAWNPPSKEVGLGMLLNDSIGDCAIACPLHIIQYCTAQCGIEFMPTDAMALVGYEAVGGYKPGDSSTDGGCVIEDVMRYWQKTGFAGYQIDAYATLAVQMSDAIRKSPFTSFWRTAMDQIIAHLAALYGKAPAASTGLPLWQQQMMDAIYYFGASDIGVALPETAQGQADWSVVSTKGKGAPGSWGGHSIAVVAPYDDRIVSIQTWGTTITATWEFLATYMDEAKLVVGKFLVDSTDNSPLGFNYQQLMADKDAVTA